MTTSLTEEKIWHLQQCPLLAGVGQQDMDELSQVTVMEKLEPQDRIVTAQNQPGNIWLIKEGLVSLTYGDADGKDATVLLLESGDLFGAMEGIGSEDYGENIVALRPTVLCRMTRQQMDGLLNKHPEIAYRITKFSWRRIARLQERLAEIMTKSVRERLAALLLRVAAAYGEQKQDQSYSLGLTITHDDLARLVGSSREMVSKVMSQFRDAGWVRSSRKSVELLDRQALQQVLGPS